MSEILLIALLNIANIFVVACGALGEERQQEGYTVAGLLLGVLIILAARYV
jgi:hypothetical protein